MQVWKNSWSLTWCGMKRFGIGMGGKPGGPRNAWLVTNIGGGTGGGIIDTPGTGSAPTLGRKGAITAGFCRPWRMGAEAKEMLRMHAAEGTTGKKCTCSNHGYSWCHCYGRWRSYDCRAWGRLLLLENLGLLRLNQLSLLFGRRSISDEGWYLALETKSQKSRKG